MSGCSSRLDYSPYLSQLAERFGEPDDKTAQSAIKALETATASELPTLKAQFALGWAHLALTRDCDFDPLGQLQSRFADKAIDIALRDAWTSEGLKGDPEGVFILGLGKLGGHDLNFSSDIDLIAYFDADQLSIPKAKGQAYILDRVMKRLTKTLMPPHEPDFVYRVDWRLRPEASVSGLAMSTERAAPFYFFRALPWHRLALLKARVVAGDKDCAKTFLAEISPFLWRQNLDYRALDELAALKTRINLEHPRLKQERAQPEPILDRPLGFNVKLGAGGIREVEFIANAQQMIWGGKHYPLRTTNTLTAIKALNEEGHIHEDDAKILTQAYQHHRRLENALQMLRNGHEHTLPDTEEDWTALAGLIGKNVSDLMSETTTYRRYVHQRFSSMFDVGDAAEAQADLSSFSDLSRTTIDHWLAGFTHLGIRNARRGRLEPLGAALARRAAQSDTPDLSVQRIDRFLRNLSRSEQYLSMLATHPALLDALIDPLLYSPHMSVLLEQSPHIIDTFLDPSPPSSAFVLAEADYETRLERLRRFVNEGLFQHYHGFLNGLQDWRGLADGLTRLAETALETALTITRDDLGEPDLKIAVLGLGKLGQSLMAPQSDLDLIFLFDDDVDRDLASKAVRRLRTIITTPLREGIAYELDMRLRPSGRSGPPAVTLSAFAQHHDKVARNWEHIALVPARVVAGDKVLGDKIQNQLTSILQRPRDQTQLLQDAHAMWSRIAEERIRTVPANRFDTKLRGGGLMMADFWDAVASLSGAARLTSDQHSWTELLYWERLLGLTGAPIDSLPERYAEHLPTDLESRQAELETRVRANVPSASTETTLDTMRPVHWL